MEPTPISMGLGALPSRAAVTSNTFVDVYGPDGKLMPKYANDIDQFFGTTPHKVER